MAAITYSEQVAKDFNASMLTRMTESKGGLLTDLGELREITGAESTTFNRADDGETTNVAPNLYASGDANCGGTYSAKELGPTFEYSYEKVPDVKFRKSQVNYKGYIPTKLTRMLDNSEDKKVITTILASTLSANGVPEKGKVTLEGDLTKELTDSASVSKLIGIAKGAAVDASDTPDKRAFTKMVMGKETYKLLYSSEKLINSDYVGTAKTNDGSTRNEFYGCEVVIMKNPPATFTTGMILFIPSMTLGFARWKAANATEAKFELGNEDSWMFIAKKSFGVAVIEEESITLFKSKETV